MARKLTATGVEKLKAGKVRREIPDGGCPGLYLIVQPKTGAKSWAMRFRVPGRAHAMKLTLGPFDNTGKEASDDPEIGDPLTIKAAHLLAADIKRQRQRGVDVIANYAALKRSRQIEIEQDAANTFAVLARKFITEHAQKKTRRWHRTARFLGLRYPKDGVGEPEVIPKGLCERWANMPVGAIGAGDIYNVVYETQHLGVPGLTRHKVGQPTDAMARVVFATLSSFFGWCVQHRKVDIDKNPCTGGYRPKPPKVKRDRVLSKSEIVAFWKGCDAIGEPIGQVLKLLLLTGCRVNEVREMTRSELSEDGTWTIPGARTKNHLTHVVPLPPLARDILASARPVAGKVGFVFTLNGKKPISISSTHKHKLDALVNIPAWTQHDLRRTAATGMAEIGIPPHIVEACLNHISGAKVGVAGTYNRAAYGPEKQAALERWAAHVQGLVSGKSADNVLDFAGKRGA